MAKNKIPLIIGASLLFALTACQPPSPADRSDASDEDVAATSAQTTTSPDAQPLAKAKTPKELTTALVNLSEDKLRDQLICSKLDDHINAVDHTSKIESVRAVQRQLKVCLPAADEDSVLQWLQDYQAMYARFLQSDSSIDDADFFTVMNNVKQGKSIAVAQLRKISPRARYLIGLIRSNADVSIRYLGANDFEFHHDLAAMADIFTPYLADDQSEFVQRMAQDNQSAFWFDNAVALPFEALIERAVFWEDFMQRHPDSRFYGHAETLFDLYRYLLFFGANNVQWTDKDVRKFYIPANERLMMQLTEHTDSRLTQDAQTFLAFMQLSDSERQQRYPIPDEDNNGQPINTEEKAHYQLMQALALFAPWDTVRDKNCLNGIICRDEKVE